jgi:hypothetical protein
MPDAFPSTQWASTRVRLSAVAIGLAAVALATRTIITSSAWIGPLPAFLVLVNRVVPSVGVAGWSGAAVPGLYQSQVVEVNGRACRCHDGADGAPSQNSHPRRFGPAQ